MRMDYIPQGWGGFLAEAITFSAEVFSCSSKNFLNLSVGKL